MTRCPICRANLIGPATCPRCKADLGRLTSIEKEAENLLIKSIEAGALGDFKEALSAATQSSKLRNTEFSSALLDFWLQA